MLQHINLQNLLILDIETVPVVPELHALPEEFQELWLLKEGKNCAPDLTPQQHYFNRAGIFAEFGKIICISCGYFYTSKQTGQLAFRIKSFYGSDECRLLEQFCELLNLHYNKPDVHIIAGHNLKEFDIPFICRRTLVNGCMLPRLLDIAGRKPWEVNFLDTLHLWRFGDHKNYTSLRLLAAVFNIPTPKDDIDGSEVATVYWQQNDLERIVKYCQKDVVTVAQLILKFKGIPLLKEEEISVAE